MYVNQFEPNIYVFCCSVFCYLVNDPYVVFFFWVTHSFYPIFIFLLHSYISSWPFLHPCFISLEHLFYPFIVLSSSYVMGMLRSLFDFFNFYNYIYWQLKKKGFFSICFIVLNCMLTHIIELCGNNALMWNNIQTFYVFLMSIQ